MTRPYSRAAGLVKLLIDSRGFSRTGLARSNTEDAESAQFDTVARGQGLLEPFEYGVHGSFRLGPRQACPLDDVMHNILLDQCLGPFIEEIWENLAPAKAAGRSGLLARCYWE